MIIGCTASLDKFDAINIKKMLIQKYNFIDLDIQMQPVDIVIMLGGDGFALRTIHKFIHFNPKFYGINYGTFGFLMNNKSILDSDNFENIITQNSQEFIIKPLIVKLIDKNNIEHNFIAINEVTISRKSSQAVNLKVSINKQERTSMIGDGILVATPIGSTAYNVSIGGPILPTNSSLIAITPISPFRPRYWRGAILENDVLIDIDVVQQDKRPAFATADFHSVEDIVKMQIALDKNTKISLLFDNSLSLKERIMREQFMVYN